MTEETARTYNLNRAVHCAEFIAGDQHITYGYSAEEVERLIEKALGFLKSGAAFLTQDGKLIAEKEGEQLVFSPDAAQKLEGRRNERAYLLALTVHQDYRAWATKFIPLKAQVDVRRVIEGLDVPVAFSEFRLPPPGSGPEAQVTRQPLEDITEALDKHVAFVILGEPGAGKTTTLQKIALEAARALLEGMGRRVPLFVRLSQQGNREPFAFLKDRWEQHTGTDFANALAAGQVLILADGINEIARHERDTRLKDWRLFTEEYAGANQVVFSGREKDYDSQLNLPRVNVEPLDDARIADYLQRNDAEGLADLLDDPRTRLRQMAGNPFNLSLLAYAYKSNQRDMTNRGHLLHWFVGELYAREERLAHPGWIARDVQTRAFSQLAFAMQKQGVGTTFPLKTACEALPANVDFRGEERLVPPADLFRFGRAATILDPGVEPDIRFYHHLLQEYFAALELLRCFDNGEDLTNSWRATRTVDEMPPASVGEWDPLPEPPSTDWEVTTILACGLNRDPARFIDVVRQLDPALAGRCLDEAGIIQPEDVLKQTRTDLLADLYNPKMHLRARLQAGLILGRIGDPRFEVQEIDGVKVISPQMVGVSAGKYWIGSRPDEPNAFDDEKPAHQVNLPAFQIAKWPVTNAEFACFMQAGGYEDEQWWQSDLAKRWLKGEDVTGGQFKTWLDIWKQLQSMSDVHKTLEETGNFTPNQIDTYVYVAGLSEEELKAELGKSLSQKSRSEPAYWKDMERNNPSQPVVGITWFEARAYCTWLSAVTGKPYRLPSEVEWEAAARGPKRLLYPWDNEWDVSRANSVEGRVLKPSPVGAYAAAGGSGPFGAEDQSGNVWNWTTSLYLPYPYQTEQAENLEAEGERVVRGGSWNNARDNARCAYRTGIVPVNFYLSIGFRLVSPGSNISGS